MSKWMYTAVGFAAAAAIGVGAWLLWPNQGQADRPAQSKTFELRGSLTLTSVDVERWSDAPAVPCSGRNGYKDLTEGAAVTVYNGEGAAVAVGQLRAGQWINGCRFSFTIPAVPESSIVQVEVSHRGKLSFSLADAQAGRVDLSLRG